MEAIFKLDNTLKYTYGTLMWLVFFIPQFVVLLVEQTASVARTYLLLGALLSVLSYAIYGFYFFEGRAASTPAMVAITMECMARWVLAAYYDPTIVVDETTPGVLNGIILAISGATVIGKIATQLYVSCHRPAYFEYSKDYCDHVPGATGNA